GLGITPRPLVVLGGALAVSGQGEHLGGERAVAEALVALGGLVEALVRPIQVARLHPLAGALELARGLLAVAAVAIQVGQDPRGALALPDRLERRRRALGVATFQEQLGRALDLSGLLRDLRGGHV